MHLFFLICLISHSFSFIESQEVIKKGQCLDGVCIPSNYNKAAPPNGSPLFVDAVIILDDIYEINLQKQTASLLVYTELSWLDNRIRLETNSSLLSGDSIWVPEITVPKVRHLQKYDEIYGYNSYYAYSEVESNSTRIRNTFNAEVELGCTFFLTAYPFYWGKCEYEIRSSSLNSNILQFREGNSNFNKSDLNISNFKLSHLYGYQLENGRISNSARGSSSQLNPGFSQYGFKITVTYKPIVAIISNFIPSFILLVVDILSFFAEQSNRFGLPLVTLLAFINMQNNVQTSITANIPNTVAYWLLICTFYNCVILIGNVYILRSPEDKVQVRSRYLRLSSILIFVVMLVCYFSVVYALYPHSDPN